MKENFFENVYAVVRQIPAGRVTSYGVIGAFLGSARGARMVGWAMNNAHSMSDVPAHRVVNKIGVLSGKLSFITPTTMQERLEAEGVSIENDQVVDFKKHFWDPAVELI